MKSKGFTLIELLAVIILIGAIGLIAVPTVNKTIEKQKEKTFKINVNALINAVKSDAENDKFVLPRTYLYNDNTLTLVEVKGLSCSEDLQVGGKFEDANGTIKYNQNGEIYVAIKNDKYCSKKMYDGEIAYGKMNDSNCIINNTTIDLSEE